MTERQDVSLLGRQASQEKIASLINKNRWPQVVLLAGERGIGKARLAQWIGQSILCQDLQLGHACEQCHSCRLVKGLRHPDLAWYMPHPSIQESEMQKAFGKLDEWREKEMARWREDALALRPDSGVGYYVLTGKAVRREVGMTPVMSQKRVVVLTDLEKLAGGRGEANEAANSLLKILEEPAAGTYFLLHCNQAARLPETIRSRSTFWPLGPLSSETIKEILEAATPGRKAFALSQGVINARVVAGPEEEAEIQVKEWIRAMNDPGVSLRIKAARSAGTKEARGKFSGSLMLLGEVLHQELRERPETEIKAGSEVIRLVEVAYTQAQANGNPQLILYCLLAGAWRINGGR